MSVEAIGIDLGTTNCCVAVVKNGRYEVIKNKLGSSATSSFVYYNIDEILVGDYAKIYAITYPENVIYGKEY